MSSLIPEPRDHTLDAVDAALVASVDRDPRPYFGVSTAGVSCSRRAWLTFRWCGREELSAQSVKAIEDGHRGEALMAERLRMVRGIQLHTVDAEGKQFAVGALGGHLRGHMDGAILGLLQAPKSWHVWEHKQVNEKKFDALHKAKIEHGEKDALEHWDPVFYVQAQLYMRLSELPRHYLTVGTPGGRNTMSCRTELDKAKADKFLARAESTIFATEPPARISDDPAWYECRFCPFHAQCHAEVRPAVTCRSCAHATPSDAGEWHCEHHGAEIPIDAQRTGCDGHRYIPVLLERVAELVDVKDNTVRWRNKLTQAEFVQPPYDSRDLANAPDFRLVGDPFIGSVKEVFGPDARITARPVVEHGDAPASSLKEIYGPAAA